MPPRPPVWPVALMLLASGCCALIYQVAWLGELRLVFGGATAAGAAVTAIFMGGLGLGNALLDRLADRSPRPLAWYARLEVAVAVCAALSPWLIDLVRHLYRETGGQLALGPVNATLLRLGLSAIVLGVPAFLMGGTLPAAAVSVSRPDDPNRRGVAWLYGLNTLGAVVGALAATFVLLESLGPRVTIWLGVALNLLVAAAAWSVSAAYVRDAASEAAPAAKPAREPKNEKKSRREKARRWEAEDEPAETPEPVRDESPAPRQAWWVYAMAGLAGFSFMLMELVWFRMLAPVLGGSTFTFGLILGIALLGVGLGGALYPLVYRERRPTLAGLALTCAAEAVCLAAPFAAGDWIAEFAITLYDDYSGGFSKAVGDWFVIASLVVLPASLVAGFQFPLLVALLGSGDRDVGVHVGRAYAWNTLGSIAGSLAGGFGLLPVLTAPGAWRLVIVLLLLAALALALRWYYPNRRLRGAIAPLATCGLAAYLLAFPGPSEIWRHAAIGAARAGRPANADANQLRHWRNTTRGQIAWESEGIETSLGVQLADGLAFVVNGKIDGHAIYDAHTQVMCGLLGAMLHPEPKRALVVGLGTGQTGGWLAEVQTMERVDVVELEPAVAEMAEFCAAFNFDVLHHPRVRVIYNDAREVVGTIGERYDVIASEPSNPYRAGVSNLFTREFYADVKSRLNPGGVFAQFLQSYEIDEDTVRLVLATLRSEFGHVEIWQTSEFDMLLLCFVERPQYTPALLREKIAREPFKTALPRVWRATTLEGVLGRFVASASFVDSEIKDFVGRENTDDFNRVEYGFVRTLGAKTAFQLAKIGERAEAAGQDRPAFDDSTIDWAASLDERRIMRVVESAGRTSVDRFSPDQLKRGQAIIQILTENYAEGIKLWESQPQPPRHLAELTLVALAYAETGNDKAGPLLDELTKRHATDATLIRGIWQWNSKRRPEAIASLCDGFAKLREPPFATGAVPPRALRIARWASGLDPKNAETLLPALERPFVLGQADRSRRWTACVAASAISPEKAVPWFLSFEPHVPWTDEALDLRVNSYTAARHPLLPRAIQERSEYYAAAKK